MVKHWIWIYGNSKQNELRDVIDHKLTQAGYVLTGSGSDGRQWDVSYESPDLVKDICVMTRICEEVGLKHYTLMIQHIGEELN